MGGRGKGRDRDVKTGTVAMDRAQVRAQMLWVTVYTGMSADLNVGMGRSTGRACGTMD